MDTTTTTEIPVVETDDHQVASLVSETPGFNCTCGATVYGDDLNDVARNFRTHALTWFGA